MSPDRIEAYDRLCVTLDHAAGIAWALCQLIAHSDVLNRVSPDEGRSLFALCTSLERDLREAVVCRGDRMASGQTGP